MLMNPWGAAALALVLSATAAVAELPVIVLVSPMIPAVRLASPPAPPAPPTTPLPPAPPVTVLPADEPSPSPASLAAEPAVYGIHIGNEPGQFALIHIIIQIAAIIGGQRELAIGKGAGTAPAGHDIGPTVSGRCRSIPV